MAKLKAGDRIDCCIKSNVIVNPYISDFEEVKTFEILTTDSFGCFIFIPQYYSIKNSVNLDQNTCKHLDIEPRFAGENMVYIKESLIYKINYILDGCKCAKCFEFYPMATGNQENGTLICWSCLASPYH